MLRASAGAVHASNQRAIRAYTACGFVEEGRLRAHVYSNGRYDDLDAQVEMQPVLEAPLEENAVPGAQEQMQAATPVAASNTATPATGATTSVARTVLQGLDLELRAELLKGLREGALGLLKAATPVLVEPTDLMMPMSFVFSTTIM